jgi:hypothetical protein
MTRYDQYGAFVRVPDAVTVSQQQMAQAAQAATAHLVAVTTEFWRFLWMPLFAGEAATKPTRETSRLVQDLMTLRGI